MKNKYLLILFTLFIIWLYLFLYLNRYVIVSSAGAAYKLNRITGKSTLLYDTKEKDIKKEVDIVSEFEKKYGKPPRTKEYLRRRQEIEDELLK